MITLPLLAHRGVDDVAQLLARVGIVFVQPVAVGALHDHDVGFRKGWVAGQDGAMRHGRCRR